MHTAARMHAPRLSVLLQIPDLVHADRCIAERVPVIKRYSGGGTVVITDDVFLVSFIMGRSSC